MKTNNTIGRLGALILVGSIVVLTASAADTTTATDKPAANTAPTGTATPTTDKPDAKRHHWHHWHDSTAPNSERSKMGTSSASSDHAWLGVIAEDTRAHEGYSHHPTSFVRLARVIPDSPAYSAGLREGDVIRKFAGSRLWSAGQLRYELRHEKQGEIVPVEIYRHGRREELNVTLGTPRTVRAEPSCPFVPKAG